VPEVRTAAEGAAFDPRLLGRLPGLEWKARYVMEGFLSGRHGSPFHGPSVEFRDYREYQPGDDLRRIDWRLYARNDRLCIRRYEQETNARCYVLVDTSASMAYRGGGAWGSKFEAAKLVGLAIAWLLLDQADAVGLLAVGASSPTAGEGRGDLRYVRPSQKPDQAGLLLRELERLSLGGGPVLADLLGHAARIAHRRSLIVLLSDLLEPSEALRRNLERLRFDGHEAVCLQVLDGDEIDFPFEEPAVFEDMETGLVRHVAGREAREAYRTRFQSFLDEWRGVLRDLDLRHAVVRTDEDPAAALRHAFRRARKSR
jgi:uncharacterized protein (DUF58 family)